MLNEEAAITETLQAIRRGAREAELIVVDGGSTDRSVELASPFCDRLLRASRGRARQMNAGAAAAHGDTIVPTSFARDIENALRNPGSVGGRFDLLLDDPAIACRALAILINSRSRLTRS